jgi:hypothetical protein
MPILHALKKMSSSAVAIDHPVLPDVLSTTLKATAPVGAIYKERIGVFIDRVLWYDRAANDPIFVVRTGRREAAQARVNPRRAVLMPVHVVALVESTAGI